MSKHDLSAHQVQALQLLRADRRRDLYEGAGRANEGCGMFWITYSADESYAPWTAREVEELAAAGLLVQRWPGCFTIPESRTEGLS